MFSSVLQRVSSQIQPSTFRQCARYIHSVKQSNVPGQRTTGSTYPSVLTRVGISTGALVSALASLASPLKPIFRSPISISTPSASISTQSEPSYPTIPQIEYPPVVPLSDAVPLTHRFVTKHDIKGLLYDSVPSYIDKVILIGDIHGCYDELLLLLDKVQFDSQRDIVVFLGDLVGKGHKSMQVLDFVMNMATRELQEKGIPIETGNVFNHALLERCFVIRGNHEQYVISYADYLADKAKDIEQSFQNNDDSSLSPQLEHSSDTISTHHVSHIDDPHARHLLYQRINNLINAYPVKSPTHLTVAKYCQYHLKEMHLVSQEPASLQSDSDDPAMPQTLGILSSPTTITTPTPATAEGDDSLSDSKTHLDVLKREQHEMDLLKGNRIRYNFLNTMPYYISFPELELLCVHAGVIPDYITSYGDRDIGESDHDHGRSEGPNITLFSRDSMTPNYDDSVQHPTEYNLLFMDGDMFLNMRNVKLRKRFRKDFKRVVREYERKTSSLFADAPPQDGDDVATPQQGTDTDAGVMDINAIDNTNITSSDEGEWSDTDVDRPAIEDYFAPLIIRDDSFQSKYKVYSHHKSGKIWSKSYSDYVKYQKAKNQDYSNQLRFPHLVFGHDAVSGLQFEDYATGLDTGCCYGRKLSALVFHNPKNPQYTPPEPMDPVSLQVEEDGSFIVPRKSCHPLNPQLIQVDALDLYAPH